MSHSPRTKYRPYLTLPELDIIISSLKISGSNPHLIHYLEGFKSKIDLGITSPNLTLTPRPGVMERLELGDTGDSTVSISIETKRANAYTKWLSSPQACTAHEIELTHLYRFENDLMSPEEESIYLQSQGAP